MTLFGKSIVTLVILAIIGIGAYSYFLRPVKSPSDSGDQAATSTNDSGLSDNGTSTDAGANSASSTNSGQVASYKIAAGSKAEFNIDEVLRGSDFTVVGTTEQVSGAVTANINDPSKSIIGEIKINARTFKTDTENRDRAIARFVLKSEEAANEYIVFTPKEISGLPADAAAKVTRGENISFKVKGDLKIAGVTKSVTFDATFALKNGQIQGSAQSKIKRSDFSLTIPSVPFVASVEDEMIIKINATMTK